MRKFFVYLTAFCYLGLMSAGCAREKNELVHDHAHEHGHEGHGHDDEGHEGHGHGASGEIILEPELAAKMGVRTATIEPGEFAEAIRVSGVITGDVSTAGTITAPTEGIFSYTKGIAVGSTVAKGQVIGSVNASRVSGGDPNAAAKANLEYAKRELDRLAPLYEKKLITAEKYNTAVAAYEVARAAYSPSAANGTVTAPVAGVVTGLDVAEGQFVEKGAVIGTVADGAQLTLTANVPQRYASDIVNIDNAVIRIPGAPDAIDIVAAGGRKMSGSAPVSRTPGYVPVVFTFPNPGRMVTGSVVQVFLQGKSRGGVISVPVEAITEQQGNYFVFVKVDDEGYVKMPVRTGHNNGRRVEILEGVRPGDEVVVSSVTALRLAETSGAVPEGHSHSH